MSELTNSFNEIDVVPNELLTEIHRPILQGRKLVVSPAMYQLMKNASTEELEKLLESMDPVVFVETDFTAESFFPDFVSQFTGTPIRISRNPFIGFSSDANRLSASKS